MGAIVGLTGSIATGKSTVAALFAREEIPIVDADLIARQVIEPGQRAYDQVVQAFGHEILAHDQSINRVKLGQMIFNDQKKRAQLNQIVHPVIIEQLIEDRDRLIKAGHPLIVLDIPLLYELDLAKLVDRVVVVYSTTENQLIRLMARDQLSEREAQQRIDTQISIDEKKQRADYIIDNNGTKQQTETQFHQLLEILFSM
ncbi:dephospho-CoA kinase [Amphibacillus indicireducens]|uniref:Dephospho-CoA kinase n=1 Tax=Amphibacillus indicireducens TaxID=1076330 RepID=A0ABP7W2H1_9BACI